MPPTPFLHIKNIELVSNINTDHLWTVAEVADYLRLNPETIRFMARNSQIPSIKVGRVWRFRESEIRVWLDGKK